MAEVKEKGVFLNPYVMQMDKFADSLIHLSKTFFTLEGYKGTFSEEEFHNMFTKVTDKVCEGCERKKCAWGKIKSRHIRCFVKFYILWMIMALRLMWNLRGSYKSNV